MSDICKNDGTQFNSQGICETCGATAAQQAAPEAAASQATASNFCMKCGNRLNGAVFCPQCGTPAGQRGGTQTVYVASAPAQPSAFTLLLRETWDYIKAFFTSNPFSAIRNASLTKSHLWAILGTVICLISTLGLFSFFAQPIDSGIFGTDVNVISLIAALAALSGDSSAVYSNSSKLTNMIELTSKNVAVFFSTLFIVILVFLVFSVLLKGFFAITKKNVGFVTVMNLQSVALLPFAVCAVIAAIAAFISPVLAALILLFGTLFSYIYLYFGIQKAVSYTKTPFWLYGLLVIAHYAAIYLIVLLFYAIFC